MNQSLGRCVPDLPTAMGMVPQLLPACLSSWEPGGKGLGVLRLVNKEISRAAVRAVRSCALQVGEGAWPDMDHVVRVLSLAKLEDLKLAFLTSSGCNAPSAELQQATCMLHLRRLTEGLQSAMQSVKQLHITIHHTHHLCESSSPAERPSNIGDSTIVVCKVCGDLNPNQKNPHSPEVRTHALLEHLAAAVPRLQKLDIGLSCQASVLHTFGALCPHLSSLAVDVMHVPASDLQALHKHLPCLTDLALGGDGDRKSLLAAYVDASMAHLQHCERLAVLELDFGDLLSCNQECLDLAPASLVEVRLNNGVGGKYRFKMSCWGGRMQSARQTGKGMRIFLESV